MKEEVVTAIGTPNIALVKYWGKRDAKLVLPTNSSISLTLDESVKTTTSILFSKRLKADMLYVDGELEDMSDDGTKERFRIVDNLRKLAGVKDKALVVSANSFPAASGIASSASGCATLTFVTAKALGLKLTLEEQSRIARLGSGSACRSLHGGFVKWNKGDKPDGSDSYAEQILDGAQWPGIIDIIAIVSKSRKKVSSRAGQAQTVATSALYRSRMDYVEGAVARLEKAIKDRDFQTLAEITMRDSDNMHAVMLDTWPPIFYMNDVSRDIVYKILELNESEGKAVAAYTFDAGANAHIITTKKNRDQVMGALRGVVGIEKFIEPGLGSGPRLAKDSLIDADKLTMKV